MTAYMLLKLISDAKGENVMLSYDVDLRFHCCNLQATWILYRSVPHSLIKQLLIKRNINLPAM